MGSNPAMDDDASSFCLKWNDYASNLSVAFQDLRRLNDFFDVTLLTNDGSVQAHKVILCACSDFFRDAFKRMISSKYPVQPMSIYLRGVSIRELKSVLEFMYQGEVNVTNDSLNEFLAVAEELQVKGLTNKDDRTSSPTPPPSKPSKSQSSAKPAQVTPTVQAPKRHAVSSSSSSSTSKRVKQEEHPVVVVDPSQIEGTSSGYVDPASIKDDPEVVLDTADPNSESNLDEDYEGYEGFYDDENEGSFASNDSASGSHADGSQDSRYSNLTFLPDGRVRCTLCDRVLSSSKSARQHTHIVHGQPEYFECLICKKVLSNRPHFRGHISAHGIRGKDLVGLYGRPVHK